MTSENVKAIILSVNVIFGLILFFLFILLGAICCHFNRIVVVVVVVAVVVAMAMAEPMAVLVVEVVVVAVLVVAIVVVEVVQSFCTPTNTTPNMLRLG